MFNAIHFTNQSLKSVPVALKQAMVTPLLKKPSADPDVL